MNTVAEGTCWTKVVKCISTTPGLRGDMLNRHGIQGERLVAVDTVASVGLENPTLAVELMPAVLSL